MTDWTIRYEQGEPVEVLYNGKPVVDQRMALDLICTARADRDRERGPFKYNEEDLRTAMYVAARTRDREWLAFLQADMGASEEQAQAMLDRLRARVEKP